MENIILKSDLQSSFDYVLHTQADIMLDSLLEDTLAERYHDLIVMIQVGFELSIINVEQMDAYLTWSKNMYYHAKDGIEARNSVYNRR